MGLAGRKTVSGGVLLFNGLMAALALFLGGWGYLAGWGWMQEAGGQRLCVYSGSLLIWLAAVYVIKRIWAREALVRMLASLSLPKRLRQSQRAAMLYGVVLTALVWAIILAGSFWPVLANGQAAVLSLLLAWVAVVRAIAQGEALAPEARAQEAAEQAVPEQAAEEERLVSFLAAWAVFMAAAGGALVWAVLKWHKYQWIFADMPLKWQGELVLAALGTAGGLLAALAYGLNASRRRRRGKKTPPPAA